MYQQSPAEPNVWERPDRKVLQVWRISSLVTYASLFIVAFVVVAALVFLGRSPKLFMFPAVPALLYALTAFTLRRQWENWTFRVNPEALEIAHGWIWKNRRVVARDRIQHVDINSGPFDRRFGLVQVVIHTAGQSVGMIPGLRPERAEQLRDELMRGREVK